jgi:hypothetical protein
MLPVIGLQFGNAPSWITPRSRRSSRRWSTTAADSRRDARSRTRAEQVAATIANELGIQNKIFLATRGSPPGPPQPGPAAAQAQIEALFARFKVPKIDLVQVPAHADPTHLAVLKE